MRLGAQRQERAAASRHLIILELPALTTRRGSRFPRGKDCFRRRPCVPANRFLLRRCRCRRGSCYPAPAVLAMIAAGDGRWTGCGRSGLRWPVGLRRLEGRASAEKNFAQR